MKRDQRVTREGRVMKANRNSTVFSWLLLLLLSHLCLLNVQSTEMPSEKFKAVNLGGWLVTEGWITPSLFNDITNGDLLDGTKVRFMSAASGKYLCAKNGGGSKIVANRNEPSCRKTFKLWRVADDQFHFRVFNKQFIGLDGGGGPGSPIVAVATAPGDSETFQIIRKRGHKRWVHIKALSNGMFLQAKSDGTVTADFSGKLDWGDSSNTVFVMKLSGWKQGEFQVTNGLGPVKAAQVMQKHWNEFIVEEDFDFIAKNGLNSVRIPVGWWTAKDPTPPPFVDGSLDILDKAFSWAEEYGLKVILDLHAPPYSQNGEYHSGSRDGTIEFGLTQETINKTVEVIEFFSARYASSESLAAVELINEPKAPNVSLHALKQYFEAGYAAVRRHSPTAYVIMSKRQGARPAELLALANGRNRTVIDVHYYNLFNPKFNNWTVQQHIDYIKNTRASQLRKITQANGPLSFVGEWVADWKVAGEWVAEWNVSRAKIEAHQQFANAQLEVYEKASFGWAYWTFKAEKATPWSLQWMIENGYINLKL